MIDVGSKERYVLSFILSLVYQGLSPEPVRALLAAKPHIHWSGGS